MRRALAGLVLLAMAVAGCTTTVTTSGGLTAQGNAQAACSNLASVETDITSTSANSGAVRTDMMAAQQHMINAAALDGTYKDISGGINVATQRAAQDNWDLISDGPELAVIQNLAETQCQKLGFG